MQAMLVGAETVAWWMVGFGSSLVLGTSTVILWGWDVIVSVGTTSIIYVTITSLAWFVISLAAKVCVRQTGGALFAFCADGADVTDVRSGEGGR